MKKYHESTPALIVAAVLLLASAAQAQTFKVTKYNVGGEGGHDYITAEAGTGRVFVSRGTHVMVIDGPTGKVIGDIPDLPRVHGVALAPKWNHGFSTDAGDSMVTMFDLKSLAVIKKTNVAAGGLDGIMYDAGTDRIVLTTHSKPIGKVVFIDANTGAITGSVDLEDDSPEGAVSNGKGKLFVNNEGKSSMQVIDLKSMKAVASWPLAPCEGPTGIAFSAGTNRVMAGCDETSVVLDADTGKIVAKLANGEGVDALGWDPGEKLLYIPSGRDGKVTVVHQDAADKYTVVATVATLQGAKTITVDPQTHVAYQMAIQYGPPAANAAPPANAPRADGPPGGGPPPGGGRGPRGPVIGAQFIAISH